jgi:HPt (histidine-containing phosphotransfer) domain-containing protein
MHNTNTMSATVVPRIKSDATALVSPPGEAALVLLTLFCINCDVLHAARLRGVVIGCEGLGARHKSVRDECYDGSMNAASPVNGCMSVLLDHSRIDEIRQIERAVGRDDVLSGFVRTLQGNLQAFGAALSDYIGRGDFTAAERAAHTLKGACLQLGAKALGDLFGDIESNVHAGDYSEAKRRFDGAATLIAQSLDALKASSASSSP